MSPKYRAATSTIDLKATGLSISPNPLSSPPGSLNEASNVIIRRNNVIEPRRGFKLYGDSFGSSSDVAKQLAVYKSRILRHYNTTLQFDDGDGVFSSFSGTYTEPSSGLRFKSVESNGNFYFNSLNGVQKISATAGSELTTDSGYITAAGGLKALDINTSLSTTLGSSSGYLPTDSTVAYRVLWGIKDANTNAIVGTPSSRSVIYNPLLAMLIRDFLRLLGSLDNINQSGSMILNAGGNSSFVNLYKLGITGSASTLKSNLISIGTAIDTSIEYAADSVISGVPFTTTAVAIDSGVATVQFSNIVDSSTYFTAGSRINLTGFDGFSGTLNGAETLTSVSYKTGSISAFSVAANNTELTATAAHTLSTNDFVTISGSTSTPSVDGTYRVTVTSSTKFTIPVKITVTGTATYVKNQITFATSATPTTFVITTNTNVSPTVVTTSTAHGFTTGDYVTIRGNTPNATAGVSINNLHKITVLSSTTFSIRVDESGAAGNGTGGTVEKIGISGTAINSYEYRHITSGLSAETIDSPATHAELVVLQTAIESIFTRLQAEPTTVISSGLSTSYIIDLAITSTANVSLDINIPHGATTDYYYQVYRSPIVTASTTDVVADLLPNDEMQQVIEGFPTSANLAAGNLVVVDNVPDEFFTSAATLYTNEISGEGILQANDVPPYCHDVNRFKNTIFYANTSTRQRFSLFMLGVQQMLTDYAGTNKPKLIITNGTITDEYQFIQGVQEITPITCIAFGAGIGANSYFTLNTGNNQTAYYVWMNKGAGTDPAPSGKTGIEVAISASDNTATKVAQKVRDAINQFPDDFSAVSSSAIVTITNVNEGPATDCTIGSTGFTLGSITQGTGEDASNKKILLSNLASPSLAVDQTARSMVKVLNLNSTGIVNAFYLSGVTDPPGSMLLEARSLSNAQFYLLGTSSNVGSSFNPDISPNTVYFTGNTIANPTVVTTSSAHGLINGDQIVIVGSNSTPSVSGLYTVSNVTSTTFTVPVHVTVAGTKGFFQKITIAQLSNNETKPNRIYYSKYQQPEAVPILNYMDVGSENSPILRIFPLRDSLFVFKQDGLFRITGDTSPFTITLFNSSCILVAPDSLGVVDNLIYVWTTKGIYVVSESGVNLISRDIDTAILPLASNNYPLFSTATWGCGYESDNSYTVFTIQNDTDTYASIGYRFNILTKSWTTVDKTNTCGLINIVDDVMYMGAGDVNYIEQERKSFTRTDYADRELSEILLAGNYLNSGTNIKLSSVSDLAIGDVLVQDQTVTVFEFNRLLQKLDLDTGLADSDYLSTLALTGGDDVRQGLLDLANKLDADANTSLKTYFSRIDSYTGTLASNTTGPNTVITKVAHGLQTNRYISIINSDSLPTLNGNHSVTRLTADTFSIDVSVLTAGTINTGTFVTLDNTFTDMLACFNLIIDNLNNDTGVHFNNYTHITENTPVETIITEINRNSLQITLGNQLPYVLGDLIVYKAITTTFTYSPVTAGDPLKLKHLRESTVIFENRAFTSGTLSFATDLLPAFNDVPFSGDGNGIFGNQSFGTGFFGGASNSAPFRTLIPRFNQRCRYIIPKFSHSVAREKYSVLGITITGDIGESERAYR